ncbi:polysaccharide deacetylase family protein [Bradyrhizobium guangdongense]|uniref:Chitooligosaccharide deacetylase n=1 Tax=Bradyrhizobium guangdongense TaxID=1325090 RepID=A0A410V4C9_9BRAD|nr:polysaccharide deacetylase family protein [Bradyrhizobium guangdongense]QAU38512.1 hypothetical protein X265_13135 [Bradyrhizobium guangdongense]QOZ59572.1 hypothetical protein XH86_13140 [Bradyrhizobium guangdongense]GGI33828.1 hypothetical protein GCM10010987_76330 [Bradyrhizobium guangdongense]
MVGRSTVFNTGLRAVLFHHFFFDGESSDDARERLKRQCDWLCRNFNLVTLGQVQRGLATDDLPPNALLVTIDDAKIEILSVLDIFQSFDVPIGIFACVGWSARENSGPVSPDIALATLVTNIQWYQGAALELNIKGQIFGIGGDRDQRTRAIDSILTCADWSKLAIPPELDWKRQGRGARVCCSIDELADIASERVAIGGHSVTHIKLATASSTRLHYEVGTTQKILTDAIGHCGSFAYPYGMQGTHDDATHRAVREAGFELAFLTHSGLIAARTDRFRLPRISMPDRAMSQPEFRVRAAGAGIAYRKLKSFFSVG